ENIRPTSTVQQHVLDHGKDFVAMKTVMKDAKVMVFDHHSRRHPVPVKESWALLYVHPKSGLLIKNHSWREAPPSFKRDKPKERRRDLGPFRQAHLFGDGAWWDVVLERIPFRTRTVRNAYNQPVTEKIPLAVE